MDESAMLAGLLQAVNVVAIAYGVYAIRQKNDALQDTLALKVIQDKVNKYDILEKSQEQLKQDFENQKRLFAEENTNRLALSRTIEDQSRKITQLTVDIERANNEIDKLKTDNRSLHDENVSKALTISVLQNERDIATARYEATREILGKININVSSIEVQKSDES